MKRKRKYFGVLVVILVLFIGLSVRITPASAQAGPALAVDPAEVNLPLGEQFVIKLTVTDGVDVNGFALRLTYDQGLLVLRDWGHGGYLGSPACVTENKSPGLLALECTQEDGQPAANGNGALLELTFDTIALGTSNITLEEAVFVDDQGLQSQPDRRNGVVNIQNLPTWTATATQTSTITLTPTQAPPTATTTASTSTPTPFPTDTQTAGTLTPTWTPTQAGSLTPEVTPTSGGTSTPDGTTTLEGTPSEGPPTKTLTTPISGVAGPSRRTGTTTAPLFTLTPPEKTTWETPRDPDGGIDEDRQDVLEDPHEATRMGLWGSLLLGAGVFVLVALVVLILLRIRRRKRENEDLLL